MIGERALQRSPTGRVRLRKPDSYLLAGIRVDDSARASAIDLPIGVQRFAYPRVAGLGGKKVAVVWQGGATLRDTATPRLWTATLDDGQWSAPQLVGDWPTRDLGISATSSLVARGADLAFAVPDHDHTTFIYMRVSGTWRRHAVIRPTPLYTSLVATSDGFLAAIVDAAGLSVMRLDLNGAIAPAVSVATPGSHDFHFPILLAAAPAVLAIAWVDGVGDGQSVIRVSRSNDGGGTWHQTIPLVVEGGLQSFDAIARDGAMYVTGRESTRNGPWPFVAVLRGNAWQVLPVPRESHELGTVPPRFSRRVDETEVYWAVDHEKRMDREPPALVRLRLRPDCQR